MTYLYNDDSEGILVSPPEWQNMELSQLYNQYRLMQNRYIICLNDFPSLAQPIKEGMEFIQRIIAEKEKIC